MQNYQVIVGAYIHPYSMEYSYKFVEFASVLFRYGSESPNVWFLPSHRVLGG